MATASSGSRPSSGIDLGAGCLVQRSVQPVGPAVVAALQRAAPAAALGDDVPPVTADVGETPEHAVRVPRDDDREAPEIGRREGAGLRNLGGGADVVPVRREHAGALAREQGRVGVPVGGDRRDDAHQRLLFTR